MDIGLDIVFNIRWFIPFSRWLTLEVDSRNYGLGLRNGENIRAGRCIDVVWIRMVAFNIPFDIRWCVPLSLSLSAEVDSWNHGLDH